MPEVLQHAFMQRALLAGAIVAVVCPLIGVFLVLRRLALIADTLAHVALAGVALGLFAGAPPLAGALVVAVAGGVGIEALRARADGGRIVAVLEPRSNTMRAGVMKERLVPSLGAADRVFCYAAGLRWDPAEALAPLGAKALVSADFEELLEAVAREARAGDHVVIMSNGGFNGIHQKLIARLERRGESDGT
ncbi:MAG: metal ABC transporter permease [Firmicutes bacterium]|nr:metal ABC transporter permease [Bacillota bacterium]